MATIGSRTFQNQALPNETKRRLDELSDQVNKLSTPQVAAAERGKMTVRAWLKAHPAAVRTGLRKE